MATRFDYEAWATNSCQICHVREANSPMNAPLWAYKDLNQWMTSSFWTAKEKANDGQCLVASNTKCRRGLFWRFGSKKSAANNPRIACEMGMVDEIGSGETVARYPLGRQGGKRGFNSLVRITIRDGTTILFWQDRWIHGFAASDIAPLVVGCVDQSTRNKRTIQQALLGTRWALDVQGELSFTSYIQLLHL